MTINNVTEFVKVRARAVTHPIFGKVVSESKGKGKQEGTKGKRLLSGGRVNGFATQGDLRESAKDQEGRTTKNVCPCNETSGWHVAINSRECHSNSEWNS